MMNTQNRATYNPYLIPAVVFIAVAAMILFAPDVLAQGSGGGAEAKVDSFFKTINGILSIASIAIVTIAFIFAGYQVAFAHKRMTDVAPVVIGGLLVGGATEFAKMLIPAS